MSARPLCLVVSIGAAMIALAIPASSNAVRLGPDLTPSPVGGIGCQAVYSPCSYVNVQSTNVAVAAASPINGVVAEWRFRAGCCIEAQTKSLTMTLKTFRTVASSDGYVHLEPVATGPSFVIPPGNNVLADTPVELPAHLPIAVGERVGIVADNPIAFSTYSTPETTTTVISNGFSYGYPYTGTIAINAEVEPDADGDGYGDETQDCNPADPTKITACEPVFPPAPPPPLSVGSSSQQCGSGCGTTKGVVFTRPPQPVSSPRGDGGIVIALQCPALSPAPCGGILYIDLPKPKSGSPRASAVVPKYLARAGYALQPGQKKSVTLSFSPKVFKFLAQKRTRKVVVTVQPKVGKAIVTTETLRFPKPPEKP